MTTKPFVSCPKCGHPVMAEWNDCPYCQIKDIKPLTEASLGSDIIAIVVAVLFATGAIFSFFAIDWGCSDVDPSKKQQVTRFGPVGSEKEYPDEIVFVKTADGKFVSLSSCYKKLRKYDEGTDAYYETRDLLEQGIAQQIRHFKIPENCDMKKLSDNQFDNYVAIYSGLAFFAEDMPAKGCILASSGRYGNSPLRINTDTGGGYVVKLVNVDTKRTERLLFIPKHWEYEIDVPDGEYEIRYMIGSKWYGDKILFGKECSCARADRTFLFHDGQGFTITLRKVKNGNLRTEDIEMEDF